MTEIEKKELRAQKIFPRNLTARAARAVVGNPVTTRLESGVGNCYPGLEYDHRNLDRRFFPGLIFDFVSQDDANAPNLLLRGARLTDIDPFDPELLKAEAQGLASQINGDEGAALRSGVWYLGEIEQGGVLIRTYEIDEDGQKQPLDGMVVYHFVRGLEPEAEVRIRLEKRPLPDTEGQPEGLQKVDFRGWRRRFLNEDGVISEAYQSGELTQSLCSPWTHDFRDCACNYWASNHPDIVLAEDRPGESLLPTGGSADPFRELTPIDWLRADRNRDAAAGAFSTRLENRPFQMDHYEINRRWKQLAIVLGGKEHSRSYRPGDARTANPLPTPQAVAERLVYLARLEHVLILEYLYAYFSIADEKEVAVHRFPEIDQAVIFASHELLLIAISEMRHLRWANQLIWELEHAGLVHEHTGPSLEVAETIPSGPKMTRPRALRPLTPQALNDFIAVEAPSGTLDGQYAEVAATLRLPLYPRAASQLAERIIADGVEHFSRFREVEFVLRDYFTSDQTSANQPYLIDLTPAPRDHPKAAQALDAYAQIIRNLREVYGPGDMENADFITAAREKMTRLQKLGCELAAEKLGVPFF